MVLHLCRELYSLIYDYVDIHFLHFKLFARFKSNKNMYNDYNHKEVARASRIGLVMRIITIKNTFLLFFSCN